MVSRFAFHHFPDPLAVLREMARVATRPGRIVVADMAASDDPKRADALNRMERLRDPSIRARCARRLRSLFAQAGVPAPRETYYDVRGELEGLLGDVVPGAGRLPVIRQIFEDSLVMTVSA